MAAGAAAGFSSDPLRAFADAKSSAVRLGGPIFLQSNDPAALAREHRRLGYSAAYCPEIATLHDEKLLTEIQRAYAAENVVIAEVGAWKNMLDPEAGKRRENLAYVTERCALAEAIGARCCVDIAGSYNPDSWYGPDPKNLSQEFFDATVENCRHIIDHVKPTRTRFTIEMMGWNLPDGPDSYLRLIQAVDRKAFGVHLDVCNGINSPQRFYQNSAFIRECFQKLGPWLVSCHAKDLKWVIEMNVHFEEVVPGRGQVDYRAYLTELAKLGREVPLMLEHLKTAEEYDEGRLYIKKVAAAAGVKLA
ncbi:MAG TPA: TIM barrel protein [Terracidiphilus sp.]|nr:TIM barrel protein [Terracidiphilus sp.]